MSGRKSPLRHLRSRRLAIWLILGIGVWSAIATTIPQVARDSAEATAFEARYGPFAALARAVGLDHAYTAPVFLTAVVLLAVATLLCAWERTMWTRRRLRQTRVVSDGVIARLREKPAIIVDVPLGSPSPLEQAAGALGALRLKVTTDSNLVTAEGGRWGLLGSPVFHWSLGLLIVVVGLGTLMRAEGSIGIPVGESRIDTAESYGALDEGSLYRGHSGLRIEATDFLLNYMDGTRHRGPSPVLTLYDGETVLKRQRVYPNNPLRYGSLLIHMGAHGVSPEISLETPSGEEILSARPLVDFDETSPTGTSPSGFFLIDDATGTESGVRVEVDLPAQGKTNELATVSLYVEPGGWLESTGATGLTRGGTLELSNGAVLRVQNLDYYVRISVADDWSVPYIYALLVIGTIGLSVAVVLPHRAVRLLLVEDGDGRRLHVHTSHSRGDPTFGERVERALKDRFCDEDDSGGER